MNRRLVHILLLIAFGLALTVSAKYLPIPVLLGVFFVFILVSITRSFIAIRKKAATSGPISGPQKISSVVIYSSAIGAIIALMLIVFHVRYIGRPLLNFSLVLFIVGALVGIFAPSKATNITPDVKRRGFIFKGVIYLGCICGITGALLKINHHPGGKLLMLGGALFSIVFLIFGVIYTKYTRSNSK